MHEFDKCRFCAQYDESEDWCSDVWCDRKHHTDFILDVHKIFKKADDLKINISDVIALMNEVNKDRRLE